MPETEYMKTKYVFPLVNHSVTPGSTGQTGLQPPLEVEVALALPLGSSSVLPSQKLESAISHP